jgi:hypothetical protein
VIHALVEEIGPTRMTEVLRRASARTAAYDGDVELSPLSKNGSYEFLDLLEEVGGSTRAEALFRESVFVHSDVTRLIARGLARKAYAGLRERGGAWTPPAGVRLRMAEWRFPEAQTQVIEAGSALDRRDQLQAVLEPVGATVPARYEDAYERSTGSTAPLVAEMGELLAAARDVQAAKADIDQDHAWVTDLGLLGANPDALLARAAAALSGGDGATARRFATDATRVFDEARERGPWRAAIAVAAAVWLLLVLVLVVVLVARRRRAQRARRARLAAAAAAGGEAGVSVDGDRAGAAVDGDGGAVGDPQRGVLDGDDAGDAELAAHDHRVAAERAHGGDDAASRDEQRRPAGVGAVGHQDVARFEGARVGGVEDHARPAGDGAAASGRAGEHGARLDGAEPAVRPPLP